MKKEPSLLQFNRLKWRMSYLGEGVILMQAPRNVEVSKIHESVDFIQEAIDLTDIVPSYNSIALFTLNTVETVYEILSRVKLNGGKSAVEKKSLKVPICYELGIDLRQIALHANLSEEEVILTHLEKQYKAILIGFTPGFIYVDGLNKRLTCPRRPDPRKRVTAGSIGIGGDQTGIYSLDSPGGWNIIGRTPLQLFDVNQQPPMNIAVGSEIIFSRITKEDFESWGS